MGVASASDAATVSEAATVRTELILASEEAATMSDSGRERGSDSKWQRVTVTVINNDGELGSESDKSNSEQQKWQKAIVSDNSDS